MLKELLLAVFLILGSVMLIFFAISIPLRIFMVVFPVVVGTPALYIYKKYGWREGILTFILDLTFSYLVFLIFLIYLNICCI